MIVYCVVNSLGELRFQTMFSTRERVERELLDDELGEEDGYFICEREVSDEQYAKVLAAEAQEDDEADDLILGGES